MFPAILQAKGTALGKSIFVFNHERLVQGHGQGEHCTYESAHQGLPLFKFGWSIIRCYKLLYYCSEFFKSRNTCVGECFNRFWSTSNKKWIVDKHFQVFGSACQKKPLRSDTLGRFRHISNFFSILIVQFA